MTNHKHSRLSSISLIIAILTIIIIFNEFIQIIPTHQTKLEGILILLPIVTAPIGIAFGLRFMDKKFIGLLGVILNILLLLFIPLYHIIGTLIYGP